MTLYRVSFALLALILLPTSPAAAGSLTVDESAFRARSLVYELPDDERRADAISYIQGIHDKFSINLDTIDASKLDDSTLKNKLKSDFVLYTTIGSRLFNAAVKPLNIRIDGNTLHWKGVTAPVSELRLILVSRNPYGEGNCAVYAAGSNRLLAGINNVSHGPCSYHIFSGDKLLKEGYYNEDFASLDRIPLEKAVADVRQFFSTLQRVHSDLLAKADFRDYLKLKQQTVEDVRAKLDKDGQISMSDLAYILYYAAAFFCDSHTSVHWRFNPNEYNTQGIRFPPFLLDYDNGRFVIGASDDTSLQGLEVVSVDGKPIQDFLRPILDRCSGETLAFKATRFIYDQRSWYAFSNLCGSAKSLKLGLRDKDGKQTERPVKTVSFADISKLSDHALEEQRSRNGGGTRVDFLDDGRIAHFVYAAFRYTEDEKKKVDDVFSQVKARKCGDLIIDLRGNGGGNSSMGDLIFSYLYDGKFCQFSRGRARLSRDVLSSVAEDGEVPEDADIDGMVVNMQIEEESVPKPDAFFSGRVFLLVDNGTFSSASGFATMFRDYGVGKILGYETGGLPVSFGGVYSFELENSGIGCGVSWKQFFGPKPRPGDDKHGVIPDIPMTDDLLRPYRSEDDPVLAYTLDYIRKSRS